MVYIAEILVTLGVLRPPARFFLNKRCNFDMSDSETTVLVTLYGLRTGLRTGTEAGTVDALLLCSDCSPCIGYNCMEFASCSDVSTDQDPMTECVCQLGRVKSGDGQECVIPPPSTPTPRPIPTLQV